MKRILSSWAQALRPVTVLLLALLAGCASLEQPLRGNLQSETVAVRQCANWFRQLDAAIDRAGVRDAGSFRIAGFPYLRVDRFHSSYRYEVADDPEKFAHWVSRLRRLDASARAAELRNLPAGEMEPFIDRKQAEAKANQCAAELRTKDLASRDDRRWLASQAQAPDDYLDWQRRFGLYPLTRIPFAKGVERWHEETLADFRRSAGGTPPLAPLTRYAYAAPHVVSRLQVAAIIEGASVNPFRIPDFTPEDSALLAAAFAPVFEVETGGDFDRFGALKWGDEPSPVVEHTRLRAYFRIAHTRYDGHVLPQLVYTVWFSERPLEHGLDLLGGRLDGVMLRVTLSRDGEPLVYDSIHPCGCFHMFFPTPRLEALPPPDDYGEWAFIPKRLPHHVEGSRAVFRIATRTHYLLDVSTRADSDAAKLPYELTPEDDLRMLPAPTGTRSAYGPHGLVPGTERAERMLFWPMGVRSAGAMRQWGRHATAFLGRRHFDDPDLIERRFKILQP